MSLTLIKPIYPFRPIGTLSKLALTLRLSESDMIDLASRANALYRPVKLKSGRQAFDAEPELKRVHARIKDALLDHVWFPPYLTGSLKGRSYKGNAELHKDQAVLICEDVKGFFGSVSADRVLDIWWKFFNFPKPVAEVLTLLTVRDGALPQGAIPSSYLANLALWRDEPHLQAKMEAAGIVYSRYVDDIAMSSKKALSTNSKKALIADVYGMLRRNGLSAKREKHEIFPATKAMIITKLIGNRKASLDPKRRSIIRAVVHHAERLAATPDVNLDTALDALKKAANRVGYLGHFHPTLAEPLRRRIALARERVGAAEAKPAINGEPPPADDYPHGLPPVSRHIE